MQHIDITKLNCYRRFLKEVIETSERGIVKQLANSAGCKPSFISQIINSSVHMTLDQAANISEFLGHSEDETEYLLALTGLARTSSKPLKARLQRTLERIRINQNLASKLNVKDKSIDYGPYYESWYIGAVHMLLTIPNISKLGDLQWALGISLKSINKSLKVLQSIGLIKPKDGWWKVANFNIHIPSTSSYHVLNHLIWREYSSLRIQDSSHDDQEIHYTSLYSLSRNDSEKLKKMVLSFIKETRDLVAPSKEEEVCYLGIDCFGFKNS